MKTEKTDVMLSIEADCKKVEEHLATVEGIVLERSRIQRKFDADRQHLVDVLKQQERELYEVKKQHNQELADALKQHNLELADVLMHLREDNDATLKYHGASAEVRALVDKMRYVPTHKSLPLEERLDAMERSVAKLADELYVAINMAQ